MGTVKFILRVEKPIKKKRDNGKCPIDMIYSLHGQRKFFRTKLKLFPVNWERDKNGRETQQAVFVDKKTARLNAPEIDYDRLLTVNEVKNLNNQLGVYGALVEKIENEFEANGIVYTSEMVKDRLNEKKKETATTKATPKPKVVQKDKGILSFIDEYIQDHSASLAKGSLNVCRHLKSHITAMMKKTNKLISFETFDLKFMAKFQTFLIEHEGLSDITTAKQISVLRSVLNYASATGEKVDQSYRQFKRIKVEDKEIVHLTREELTALINLDLSNNERFDSVRDAFVFSCVTGLRYSDLARLKSENLESPGVIKIRVKKSKKPLIIPLTPIAQAILEKYTGRMKPISVKSNQEMNRCLKGYTKDGHYVEGICEMAGINTMTEVTTFKGGEGDSDTKPKFEWVGVHTGRKTFATLSLEDGVPAEVVMKIGGWRSWSSFKKYAEITDKRQKKVMNDIYGEVTKGSRIVEEGDTFELLSK